MNIDFEPLECRIAGIVNLKSLTLAEKENLWTVTRDVVYPAALLAGYKTGSAKNLIADWLWTHVPALGKTRDAIFFQLHRKIKQPGSLADKRSEAAKKKRAPLLSQADRKILVQTAVMQCGGMLDYAWRICCRKKLLSAEILSRHPAPNNRHPHCPKTIRRQVAAEIAALYQHHVRPHYNSNNIAPMERDWSNVFAQDRYEIDDKTIDVRVRFQYEEDGQIKEKIQRPQMLLIVDTKSRKALGKVLIAENNYNSRAAKTICRDVFKATGMPEEFLMECGMWKSAKFLGNNATGKPFLEVENFCTRVGVKLSHAIPGRARTKTIEGIFQLTDKLMKVFPGYIGSDEMHFKHERVTNAELLTFDEFDAKLDELLDEYNNTPQDSEIMCAYDTPNNVWKNCRRKTEAGEDSPVTYIPPQFEHLLTNHCEVAKVGLHGVKFSVAGESYHYYDESLVDFVRGFMGQQVKVWFDPESPATAVISDMKDMEHFPARRIPKSPAMAKSPEDWTRFAEASKPHRQARRQLTERYSIIKLDYVAPARTMVAEIESINRAQRMTEAKQEAAQLNQRVTAETDAEKAKNYRERKARMAWESYRMDLELFKRGSEFAPDKLPTPPDCPDPDAVVDADDGRDNSNAVLAGFMQETR